MKIIHTADWHLGWKYKGRDFTDAILRQVEVLCDLARERGADAMIVAGDVFEQHRDVTDATKRAVELLAPLVRDGMHLLLVPGNHDDRAHFEMMDALLGFETAGSERRVHLFSDPKTVEINGVEFGAVPYPIPEWYLDRPVDATAATGKRSEQNAKITSYVTEQIRSIYEKFDSSKRAVLITHLTVAGVTTPTGHRIESYEDLIVGSEVLPADQNIAYIALGHIHQRQKIPGHPIPAWYSGSVECLNMGERKDQKGALWVEIPAVGNATVEPIDLCATPFYDLQIPAAEVATLMERHPDLERAFVKLQITDADEHSPAELSKQLRRFCPNVVELAIDGGQRNIAPLRVHDLENREQTVADYLAREFEGDADLPELLIRAQAMMKKAFAS